MRRAPPAGAPAAAAAAAAAAPFGGLALSCGASCLLAAASASAALCARAAPCFGPLGGDVLLLSGGVRSSAVATASPCAVLRAAPCGGPLEGVLRAACVGGAAACGDGCGARAMAAAEALRQAEAEARFFSPSDAARRGAWQAAVAAEVAGMAEELPFWAEAAPAARLEAGWAPAACLVHTALRGSLADAPAGTLGKLVLALLREAAGGEAADARAWVRAARRAAADAPLVASPGAAPLQKSLLLFGIVVSSGLARAAMRRHLNGRLLRVAILDAPLDILGGASEALEVDGAAARRAARGWKPTMLAERAGRLAARGAALLLCTCRLSEAAIAALDASGVAAVMLVEPDEARRVATALGADVMPDALPSTLEGAALGAATELTPIALGGRSAVCVAPAEPAEPAKIAHVRAVTLVVAAPSAAMSGVYARAVRRTLRVVAQACYDDGTMALAGGGGAAEMALAAAVRAQAAPCEPPARAAARRVIAAAAEAVPRALLASGGDRRAVAVGLAALRAAHDGAVSGTVGSTVRMGVAVAGASTAAGCACAVEAMCRGTGCAAPPPWDGDDAWAPALCGDVLALGLVHPARSPALAVRDACATAARLLRLGGVAAVRRLPRGGRARPVGRRSGADSESSDSNSDSGAESDSSDGSCAW